MRAFGLRIFTLLKNRTLSQCTMEAQETIPNIYKKSINITPLCVMCVCVCVCVCVETSNTYTYVITEMLVSAKLVDKAIRYMT